MNPLFLGAYVPLDRHPRPWKSEEDYYRRFAPRLRRRVLPVAAATAGGLLVAAGLIGG